MDKRLLEDIRRGSIKAFEQLFNEYYLKVRNFAFGMTKQMDISENIAQNVFMKIWLNRNGLDAGKSFDSYIFTIVRNEVCDSFRSRSYSLKYMELAGKDSERGYEIEADYNVKEIKRILDEAVEEMPEQRRIVFRMSRYRFLSNDEIAETLGISRRTVEKHISLALSDIRKKLGDFLFFLAVFILI